MLEEGFIGGLLGGLSRSRDDLLLPEHGILTLLESQVALGRARRVPAHFGARQDQRSRPVGLTEEIAAQNPRYYYWDSVTAGSVT